MNLYCCLELPHPSTVQYHHKQNSDDDLFTLGWMEDADKSAQKPYFSTYGTTTLVYIDDINGIRDVQKPMNDSANDYSSYL